MRVERGRAVGLALAAAMFLACAARPQTPPADDSGRGRTHLPPHSCDGAEIRVTVPQGVPFSPTAILREPDRAPEPPIPAPDEPAASEGEQTASVVGRAIAGAIGTIKCTYDPQYNDHQLTCAEAHRCRTSKQTAHALAQRIREIVTPVVEVSINACPCRTYNRRSE